MRLTNLLVIACVTVFATLNVVGTARAQNADSSDVGSLGNNSPPEIYQDIPQFGGPSSVGGQLAGRQHCQRARFSFCNDCNVVWIGGFNSKNGVNQRCGLQFNIDESMFYQVATDSPGETEAASGLVRFYGQWELFGRGTNHPGMLVFKGEKPTSDGLGITPFDLGFEAGSILPTGTFFSEFDFGVTNFYWKQYLFDRQLAVAVGKIDVTDFIDVYALMNPLTHFINLAFSTNPTIAVPNHGLGVAAGGMLTDRLYMQGGFADANGQPTLSGFDTFFRRFGVFQLCRTWHHLVKRSSLSRQRSCHFMAYRRPRRGGNT